MKDILKVFLVWSLLPCVAVFMVVPGLALALGRNSALTTASYWRGQPFTLASCVVQAIVGIAILWRVPTHRKVTGMISGAIVATACVIIAGYVAFRWFGAFEQRVDVIVAHIMLWIPSVVAGCYAGRVHVGQANQPVLHSPADV